MQRILASYKRACQDSTGFYGEIQRTRTSFGRCILAERRSQRPETVKFVTDSWRRYGLGGATPVCSKQAIHPTVTAFRVQSSRTSTGVIIWSLIYLLCPAWSWKFFTLLSVLHSTQPTTAALSFALVWWHLLSAEQQIQPESSEFLLAVRSAFRAVS